MKTFKFPAVELPIEIEALLFTSWMQYFATKELSIEQAGQGGSAGGLRTYSFGDPTKEHIVLERSLDEEWSLKTSGGVADERIQEIVTKALERVSSGDLGGDIVYGTTVQAKAFEINRVSTLNFVRQLGDQVAFDGRRRLGDRVLLEFTTALPENPGAAMLFAPSTDIKVTVFSPGPIAGELSGQTAMGILEVVTAICALALGRPIELPMHLFPAGESEANEARTLRYDQSILGLARDHISLDVFNELAALGGPDGVLRVRGALLSYHAALQQSSPDVATMLLVGCLEALIVPRPEWRKEKATTRFINAIEELCPDVIDVVVNHANVEEALGYKRKGGPRARRKQLLDQIYTLRSDPSHNGLGLSGGGMLSMMGNPGTMRVALLSDLARGALLRFLQAPRSSLIGNPLFDRATP